MKSFFVFVFAALFAIPSYAREIRMTQGADAFIFDYPFGDRPISVYQIDKDEPYSEEQEGLMHDVFIMEDIYSSTPGLPKAFNLRMGRSAGINNAFAAIYNGSRYIVIDPAWLQDHWARIFVIGHELGHHVCGHTAGIMAAQPWEKELEADRFAGMLVGAMENAGHVTFDAAINNAMAYLAEEGSSSHPPRSLRLKAALEGYRDGSPCLGRTIPSGGIEPPGSYVRSPGSEWDHNGSSMKLVASGQSRTFVYDAPRDGMLQAGARSGTVLFRGNRKGFRYSGTAYVFSQRCGPAAFSVSGAVSPDQRSVTLHGKAPRRSGSGCEINGYRDETLVFTYKGQ